MRVAPCLFLLAILPLGAQQRSPAPFQLQTETSATEFSLPNPGSGPTTIALAPDGTLWFTEQAGNRIGRMAPDGTAIKEFDLPNPASAPRIITIGPDNNLWFSEHEGNRIGRITPGGRNRKLDNLTGGRNPADAIAQVFGEPEIVVGADRDDAWCTPWSRQLELFDGRSVRRHAADPVARLFGEPQRAIGGESNRCRSAARSGEGEFGRFAIRLGCLLRREAHRAQQNDHQDQCCLADTGHPMA